MRSSTRNNWCYRFLYFGAANAVAAFALAIFAARADAQQQQKEQSTSEAQQQTQPQRSAAASPVSQTQLPQIVVSAPKGKPKAQPVQRAVAPRLPPVAPENPVVAAQHALDATMSKLDQARDNNILPKIGASTYTITRQTIENLPQGDNTPIDKVILQMPGVS
jgi:hypothetical protein